MDKSPIGSADRYGQVDKDILSAMKRPGRAYLAGLGVTVSLVLIGGLLWAYQIRNSPALWVYPPRELGVYITNFVFWGSPIR
jgi:hypothetical protein